MFSVSEKEFGRLLELNNVTTTNGMLSSKESYFVYEEVKDEIDELKKPKKEKLTEPKKSKKEKKENTNDGFGNFTEPKI